MPDDPRDYTNPSEKKSLLVGKEYGKPSATAEPLRASTTSRWEVLGGTTGDLESALIRDTVTGRTKAYRVGDFLPDGSGVQEVRRGGMGTMSVSIVDEGGREGWVGAPPPAPPKPTESPTTLEEKTRAARLPTASGLEERLAAWLAPPTPAADVLAESFLGPFDEMFDQDEDEDEPFPYREPLPPYKAPSFKPLTMLSKKDR